MNNYCKLELKKSIYCKKFIITFVISLTCLVFGIIEYIFIYKDFKNTGSLYLFTESYSSGFYSILIFLSPIISSMPFALSYLKDQEMNNFNELIDTIGKKKYFHSKFLVNALLGGLVLSSSLAFYYIILVFTKGINLNDIELLVFNKHLNESIINNQILYVSIEIIFSFIFGATFANFTMCLSTVLKNRYLTIISSVFFHMLSSVVLLNVNSHFNSQIIYSASICVDIGFLPRIAYAIILNAISIFIAYMSINNKFKQNINLVRLFEFFAYLCISLLIFFRLEEFFMLYGNEGNIYEFLIYFFSGLYNVPYFISFCFLISINDVLHENKNKKTSVKYRLLEDVRALLYKLLEFMIIIILIALFMSIFKLSFNNDWSSMYKESEHIINIYGEYKPLSIATIIIINSFSYLLSIALICITVARITTNVVYAGIVTIFVVIFNIATYIGRIRILHIFSITYYCLSIAQFSDKKVLLVIGMSFLYWTCIIILLIHLYLNYSKVLAYKGNEIERYI
ncbi:MAG: hypothetical protein RSG52_08155 [Terrisporobacter sp.]|uniref:hypothetical protein n=1 Tax=Terrisporobacter sp. TaxID=1965305 RepID=UPI002FCC9E2E